ncbi:hypothetical protein [Insolitispirillum peregrinum]|uniref:Uncharacterized protein n=1 Tax=Insolitispirillum peregrinum TaxID=80876 RepID=A0A1N7JGL9_9PROT|nr:hypothetical protein [Insolitispirillum peregrinum]SIS48386.1 hypothetical protein SAMN05421779_102229 [Insolitispirillum peregrinum]
MRPSFSDLDRIDIKRCEQADPTAVGRSGTSVSMGSAVSLSHGSRFRQMLTRPRLEVTCDLAGDPRASTGAKTGTGT